MIYTLTLNPSLDYIITIDQVVLGKLNEMKDYIDRYYNSYSKEDNYGQLWWVYVENNKIVKFNRTSLQGLSY